MFSLLVNLLSSFSCPGIDLCESAAGSVGNILIALALRSLLPVRSNVMSEVVDWA